MENREKSKKLANEILVSLAENNKADAEMYLSYLLGRLTIKSQALK